jgi:hypothetical protein
MFAIECAEKIRNLPYDPIVSNRHGNQKRNRQSSKADNQPTNTTVFQVKNGAQIQSHRVSASAVEHAHEFNDQEANAD